MKRVVKYTFCAVAACLLTSPVVAAAQTVSMPSNPVAYVEGVWLPKYDSDGFEIEVKKGVVTVKKSGRYTFIPAGTVIARLNNSGKNEKETHLFTTSECLVADAFSRPDSWKYQPCGMSGARFTVYNNATIFTVGLFSGSRNK